MLSFPHAILSGFLLTKVMSSASALPISVPQGELAPRTDLQQSLFPLGNFPSSSSFTTSTSLSSHYSLNSALPISKGKKPDSSQSPDNHNSFTGFYPQGSINPSNPNAPRGGFSFYSTGPNWGTSSADGTTTWEADVQTASEITFGYSVYFQDGFQWNLGGKLPGVYGGVSDDQAVSCSGGRQSDRDGCFSVRMMWRSNGAGEAYNYLPTSVSQPADYCKTAPYSECNPQYGDSIGRGAFYFAAGAWTTVAQRVKLNDIGNQNGEIQIFVNGESKIHVTGLTLRTQAASVFRGIQSQTFFGGNSEEWASPQDQQAWFKDWSVAIIS